ncbi:MULTISPECIES: helix-turn-helix transcriptional regulator [Roseomonadaceae]|uniref:Helix-turn-helix transcriptional regulator n=1 Tax=Falsiroseomonas oleicola TaxID=2801474 RepID=A0ABS6H569_9PROT|nr:helix-turn-helix transcriptional regulator [Roseomonas oleicola]MBU8542888.1 helix-turn-helix transcriptional regulator [Roseomonas oleicola]
MPDILTLKEAAAYLRLSERALYDLARAKRLPAAQLGGKWLFPSRALQGWLAAEAGEGTARPAPPPILAGSHDPLLDWAVRQSGCGLALRAGGSLDGLAALAEGQAVAAATHLLDPDSGTFNEPAARDLLAGQAVVGLVWAWRDQGLLLAPGNPASILGVADLARPGLRVIGRQPRAGSHILLMHLLAEAGLRLEAIGFLAEPALSEDEVAAAVAEGRADCGFGIRAEAASRGLDFVPLLRERFDLVMPRRQYFESPLQTLFGFARSPAFAARAARMGGYDIGETGRVSFNL